MGRRKWEEIFCNKTWEVDIMSKAEKYIEKANKELVKL